MTHFHQKLTQRWQAALIAALFFLLATTYSIVTPIFESPDELWHYPFVWHLAQGNSLPIQDPANPQLWAQEGSQPPLYYALAALLTKSIPADTLPDLIYPNPHADIGLVSPDGNANIIVHTAQEQWPWQNATLVIHLARLFSVLLATATLLAVYALSRLLWPENSVFATVAMCFVAFNPMFIFISGSVNNDNLIILLASLVLLQLVWLVVANPTPVPLWPFFSLGVLAGLAALAKVSGLGLVGLTGITLLVWGTKRRSWKIAVAGNALVGLLAVVIAGWWYWRNFSLYGDFTGTKNMIAMMGTRPIMPTPTQLLSEFPGFARSFWGLFGYFSVPMPQAVYGLLNIIFAAGLVGWLLILTLKSKRSQIPPGLRKTWPILLGWIAIMVIGLVQWTLQTPATQGRLLFPALAALAPLWAAGWLALSPKQLAGLPALLILAIAIWTPWAVISPAYALPTPIVDLPPTAQPLGVTFGDTATLLGYRLEQSTLKPGEPLPVTLYWRGNLPTNTDYSVFLHLVDDNGLIIAQRDVFHGPGVYPTSQWLPNTQFADTYVVKTPGTAFAPADAHLSVGLYNAATGQRLPASTGGDSANFGSIRLESQPGQTPNPQHFQFEDNINLVGYTTDQRKLTPGETFTLTLYWQAGDIPQQNYKVFVHMVDDTGLRVAQHDSDPQNGAAPTGGWSPGTVVEDIHPLTVDPQASPGAYRLVVGLYNGDTGQRLRLLKDGNIWVQANSVTLGSVGVMPR